MIKTIALLFALLSISGAVSAETNLRGASSIYEKIMNPLRSLRISDDCKAETQIIHEDPAIQDVALERRFLSCTMLHTVATPHPMQKLSCEFESIDTSEFEATCEEASGHFFRYSYTISGEQNGVSTEYALNDNPFCAGSSCDIDELRESLETELPNDLGFDDSGLTVEASIALLSSPQ